MDTKRAHLVVYGATGFTGQKVCHEICANPPAKNLSWIIAGRDVAKLKHLLESLDLSLVAQPTIVQCDVVEADKLGALMARAKVCLSCVGIIGANSGPFRLYGMPVVKACIDSSTDYLDICGETEFIESVYLDFNEAAINKGISIVPACGYDCMPAEIGALVTKQKFEKEGLLCLS
jgi:short subunit dehydrogenase-like uncharacterized protein